MSLSSNMLLVGTGLLVNVILAWFSVHRCYDHLTHPPTATLNTHPFVYPSTEIHNEPHFTQPGDKTRAIHPIHEAQDRAGAWSRASLNRLNQALIRAEHSNTHGVHPGTQPANNSEDEALQDLRLTVLKLQQRVAKLQQQAGNKVLDHIVPSKPDTVGAGAAKDVIQVVQPHLQGNNASVQRVDARTYSNADVIRALPKDSHLMVTFTNSHYTNFVHNWVKHVQNLDLPFLVATFDDEALQECVRHGYPAIYLPSGLNKTNFREDIAGQFRQMGVVKVDAARSLLRDYEFATVVLSDTDTVWLRDPKSLIDAHPEADLLSSTDCLSHRLEADQVFHPHMNYRCGHIPGSVTNVAFNTGILILRNTAACVNVLESWINQLRDKAKQVEGQNWQLDDQLEFNHLLQRDMFPVETASPRDPRLVWAFEHKAKIFPISALHAANGHVMFLQQLPRRYGIVPYVVHTTFQRYDLVGKIARLRDIHAWLNDEPAYYTEGKFMSYTNHAAHVVELLATEWLDRTGRNMTAFHKHLIAASYQLHTLQDAFSIAKILNRTLILPAFQCYCYEDSVANVLESCAMKGSDGPIPFQCPADHLINVENLPKQFDYRHSSFLSHPQVPRDLKTSAATVQFSREASAITRSNSPLEPVTTIPLYGNDDKIKEALAQLDGVRVLNFHNMQPNVLSGFFHPPDSSDMDRRMAALFEGAGWCCASASDDTQWQFAFWTFPLPVPLATRGPVHQPWLPHPHLFQRPALCESDQMSEETRKFSQQPNHPCLYLAGVPDYKPKISLMVPADYWQQTAVVV